MSLLDPNLLETIISGFIVAVAFPVGALIAIYVPYSSSKRALFAAFGAGIFFAAMMLLTQEALKLGNVFDLVLGFGLGRGNIWFSPKLHQTLQSLHNGRTKS